MVLTCHPQLLVPHRIISPSLRQFTSPGMYLVLVFENMCQPEHTCCEAWPPISNRTAVKIGQFAVG